MHGGTSEGNVSVWVWVCVCVRLHVGLFLPLAVRSLAAALGPQTEAVVVLTLCRKAVSSMNPGTWPCVLRVAEL